MAAHSIEKLKALSVEKLARGRKPGLYCDGGGLWFVVRSATARSWTFRYMLDGKAREMGLGKYPEISLAEARTRAAEARRLKAHGKDPLIERDAVQAALRADIAKGMTFHQAADRYMEAHRAGWRSAKHAKDWAATVSTYADPIIGGLAVQAIDTGLVLKVLEPIWSEKPETASRLRGRIELVLDWATARGHRQGENPARWRGHLDKLLPRPSKVKKIAHHAALPFDGLGDFMATLRAQDGIAAKALEFATLTACRTGDVIGATWGEIDLPNRLWVIPGSRMKASREHRVPLSSRAVDILEGLKPDQVNGGDYVFTREGTNKPLSDDAMLRLLKRMGRSGDLTPHGMRSTFRDWCAERTSFPGEVAEMALAHAVGDKVEAAYRRGDLFEKRRAMMEQWATVCAMPTTTKVVPMQKPGRVA